MPMSPAGLSGQFPLGILDQIDGLSALDVVDAHLQEHVRNLRNTRDSSSLQFKALAELLLLQHQTLRQFISAKQTTVRQGAVSYR